MSTLDATHSWVDVVGTNADGTPYSGQMVEAAWAPTRRVGEAWAVCARCANVAPRSQMRRKGGQYLCLEFGCASEA